MADTLELDYETFASCELKDVGLDNYTRDPDARPLMAAFSINREPWRQWEARKGPPPNDLRDALMDSSVEKWAFNAQFERVVTNRLLGIPSPVKGWRCTMVLAYLNCFYGGLDTVGKCVGLPLNSQKLRDGKRLIQKFCRPQAVTKSNPHRLRDWRTDPEDWQLFLEYNVQDCIAERGIRDRLLRYFVPRVEWEQYEIDQIINDRGFPIDMPYVTNAIVMSARRKAELTEQMADITGLKNPGSPKQLLPWLMRNGYPFKDLQKDSVTKVLSLHNARVKAGKTSDLTSDCVKTLELRQWQARLSTSKYAAIIKLVGPDGKLRFLFQFAGAGRTARWAGRGVQTQNLARTPKSLSQLDILQACTKIIRDGDYDLLGLFMQEPMEALVGCLRGAFHAGEGYELVVSDLSSIETVVIAWLAGCLYLLKVIAEGLDPYKDFGTRFYKKAYEEITKHERQICKPPMLGCGYRLGGGEIYDGKRTGLWGYAEDMGVDLSKEEAHRAVKVYREAYPEIPVFWKLLEEAAIKTVRTHMPTQVGHLRFSYVKPYLAMTLPSGRNIYYFQPRVATETIHTGRYIERISRSDEDYFMYGAKKGETYLVEETYQKRGVSYMGKMQNGNGWVRIKTHGGRFCEQATQGTARDIFAVGMRRAHRAGFKLIAHSHDENIARQKKGDNFYTHERLSEIMAKPIPWLPSCPLKAAGYSADFYRKD